MVWWLEVMVEKPRDPRRIPETFMVGRVSQLLQVVL